VEREKEAFLLNALQFIKRQLEDELN